MIMVLALVRALASRKMWEKMKLWIRVLNFMEVAKEEDDDGEGDGALMAKG